MGNWEPMLLQVYSLHRLKESSLSLFTHLLPLQSFELATSDYKDLVQILDPLINCASLKKHYITSLHLNSLLYQMEITIPVLLSKSYQSKF